MSRTIVDHKSMTTIAIAQLAIWITDLAKKGYEPLPFQCHLQFGVPVVTMALYEGEANESTEESTLGKSGDQTPDTGSNGDVQTEGKQEAEGESGEPSAEGAGENAGSEREGTGNETDSNIGGDSGVESGDKPVTKPAKRNVNRTKQKTE